MLGRRLILMACCLLIWDPTGDLPFFSGQTCALPLSVGNAAAEAAIDGDSTEPAVLAQRRGRRRRKRGGRKKRRRQRPPMEATDQSTETAPDGSAGGGESGDATGSMHGAQEGTDAPYQYEVALLSDFSRTSKTTGDVEGGSADYQLFLRTLYIISASIEAGVDLDFRESSSKTEDETLTVRDYGLAFVGLYNIGNLDEDISLPYVFASLGFRGGEAPDAKGDTINSSGFRFGLGGGYRYFVDSNVAIDGELSLEYGTESQDDADDPTTVLKLNLLKVGFSLFI